MAVERAQEWLEGSAFESLLDSGNLSKLVCGSSCHSSIEQQSSNSIAAEIIFKKFKNSDFIFMFASLH